MMDTNRLAEIRARAEAATAGPWRMATNRHPETTGELWGWVDGPSNHWCWSDRRVRGKSDAQFIAHAREDVPALLDEVDRLRAELDGCKADIEAGRLVRLPCGVGDTVYDLWYSVCHNGETHPDGMGCDGCTDACDMKRVVRPVKFHSIEQILSRWRSFQVGWYFATEEAARAALREEREDG